MTSITHNNDDASNDTLTLGLGKGPITSELKDKDDTKTYRLDGLEAGAIYRADITGINYGDENVSPFFRAELLDASGGGVGTANNYDVPPGNPDFGVLVFEVPAGAVPATLRFSFADPGEGTLANQNFTVDFTVELTAENNIEKGNYRAVADYMIRDGHKFDPGPDGTLSYNLDGLDEQGRATARDAFRAWQDVAPFTFEETPGEDADITIRSRTHGDRDYSHAEVYALGETITGATIVILDAAINVMDTYIHEIGHALGLHHPGDYNASTELNNGIPCHYYGAPGTEFLIDCTSVSVMSYVGTGENTLLGLDDMAPATPMVADVIAVQKLYGGKPGNTRTGDTVYGVGDGDDAGDYVMRLSRTLVGAASPFSDIDAAPEAGYENFYFHASLADINGDGLVDLAFHNNGRLELFINKGTEESPEFDISGPRTHLAGSNRITLVKNEKTGRYDAINDWGDYHENTGGAPAVPVYRSLGGNQNPLSTLRDGESRYAMTTADLDGDGKQDIIFIKESEQILRALLNRSDGTGQRFEEMRGNENPFRDAGHGDQGGDLHPAFADLDGDGDPDMVLVSEQAGNVRFYENLADERGEPYFVEPADSKFKDLGAPFHSFYFTSPAFADLDNDGDADLLLVRKQSLVYFENTGSPTVPAFTLRSREDPLMLTLYDSDGEDTLDFSNDNADQVIDLRAAARDGDGSDGSAGVSDVYGGRGNLVIAPGTVIENAVAGRGDDTVIGNADDNILEGRAGDDTLTGGPGADTLDGGPGADTASYQDSNVGVLVRLHDARAVKFGDAEGDTLTDIEHLTGSRHNDTLAGDGGDNVLKGQDGDDVLYGGPAGGDDEMHGGKGDDRLFGGKGNDTLTGGDGNDVLKGGPGEDILVVDADDLDVLYGGPGRDTFRFFPGDLGGGTIRDFADGEDVIDLTAFTGISAMDDLDIVSHGDNVRIKVSSTDYSTAIILTDFDSSNLDNSDFLF